MTAPGPQQKRADALIAVAEQSCRTSWMAWDVTVTAGILPYTEKARVSQVLQQLVSLLHERRDADAGPLAWDAVVADEIAGGFDHQAVSFDEHAARALALVTPDTEETAFIDGNRMLAMIKRRNRKDAL